ncbi:hypothetical protein A9Q84_15650 [Halobacteriovorax marinus]|mgnify:CR=1 FL=1|uniref:Peptidase S8/S53 domain-containing protein n=1 Tax=Halobacteriovorax marinus TaxID=97084 RepID=A0A1Y5F4E5_9BACT|nr:hypothetical protein A9Q84_15650 [Halobacteriovorax marinus]
MWAFVGTDSAYRVVSVILGWGRERLNFIKEDGMRESLTKWSVVCCLLVMNYTVLAKNRLIIKYRPLIQTENFRPAPRILKKKFASKKKMQDELEALRDSSIVEYAEVDTLLNTQQIDPQLTSNDSRFNEQWALGTGDGGIEIQQAWNISVGTSSVIVAVIDTGIVSHSDINSKLLPGADLISDASYANDGGGRDNDPSDPGDWVASGDSCYQGYSRNSSWHGTHVAGIISAKSNNSKGVAGVNWNAKILPVRALGKCGGFTSDIADAIRWSVGIPVSGVATNQNPAHVINLSLGGQGSCSAYMQDAINQAKARGAVVVVAAGNSSANLDISQFTPANCQGVLVVGSNTQNGYKSTFTNYGKIVDVSAPGGGNGSSVLSLGNTGSTTPSSESYVYQSGTSMAAPHVAGIVSLMKGVNSGLYPDQLMALVKEAAKSFPSFSGCSDETCGDGVALAWRAIQLAQAETPDPNFRDEEDVLSGTAPLNGNPTLGTMQTSGGLCGSITYIGDDKAGKGPGSFFFVLFGFLVLLSATSKKMRQR